MKVLPFHDLLLAFDLPSMLTGDSGRDYVMGIGASTLTLANLTIRKASSLTLDHGGRLRAAGPPGGAPQRKGHCHGHQRAGRGLCQVQCGAQRH
ncbi:MAG: hypothetical protein MZV70_53635 [Desulfobacterales bacterium]|nr:hypothetical protein [Desulfobacterales bacterium]